MVALDEQFHHKDPKARSRRRDTSVSSGFGNRPLFIDHCSLIFKRSADAYGNTLIFTAPGADGLWFTDDDVQSDYGANENIYCGYRYDPETQNYYARNRTYNPALLQLGAPSALWRKIHRWGRRGSRRIGGGCAIRCGFEIGLMRMRWMCEPGRTRKSKMTLSPWSIGSLPLRYPAYTAVKIHRRG